MLKAIRPKKVWVLLIVFLLSAIFIAATPFVAFGKKGDDKEKKEKKEKGTKKQVRVEQTITKAGGVIRIDKDTYFVVPKGSLLLPAGETEITISVKMIRTKTKIKFYFGPNKTQFDPTNPATLQMSGKRLKGIKDLTLYLAKSEKDETPVDKIQPDEQWWGVQWPIKHFSLYYARRR